jgi:hypothetical protein
MNTILQIKIFHELLDQFFVFLERNFMMYKSDIVLIKTAVDFVKKGNPRLVVEQFVTSIRPYKKEIFDCNENFFLDYENNLEKSDIEAVDTTLILKVKELWLSSSITDTQKAYIWLYLQKLYKAGEQISK